MQIFIRTKPGIERLEKLKKHLDDSVIFTRKPERLLEIQSLLRELEGVEKEIAKYESDFLDIFPKESDSRVRKSLKTRREAILQKIEEITSADL